MTNSIKGWNNLLWKEYDNSLLREINGLYIYVHHWEIIGWIMLYICEIDIMSIIMGITIKKKLFLWGAYGIIPYDYLIKTRNTNNVATYLSTMIVFKIIPSILDYSIFKGWYKILETWNWEKNYFLI